jgi:hypothetical protein
MDSSTQDAVVSNDEQSTALVPTKRKHTAFFSRLSDEVKAKNGVLVVRKTKPKTYIFLILKGPLWGTWKFLGRKTIWSVSCVDFMVGQSPDRHLRLTASMMDGHATSFKRLMRAGSKDKKQAMRVARILKDALAADPLLTEGDDLDVIVYRMLGLEGKERLNRMGEHERERLMRIIKTERLWHTLGLSKRRLLMDRFLRFGEKEAFRRTFPKLHPKLRNAVRLMFCDKPEPTAEISYAFYRLPAWRHFYPTWTKFQSQHVDVKGLVAMTTKGREGPIADKNVEAWCLRYPHAIGQLLMCFYEVGLLRIVLRAAESHLQSGFAKDEALCAELSEACREAHALLHVMDVAEEEEDDLQTIFNPEGAQKSSWSDRPPKQIVAYHDRCTAMAQTLRELNRKYVRLRSEAHWSAERRAAVALFQRKEDEAETWYESLFCADVWSRESCRLLVSRQDYEQEGAEMQHCVGTMPRVMDVRWATPQADGTLLWHHDPRFAHEEYVQNISEDPALWSYWLALVWSIQVGQDRGTLQLGVHVQPTETGLKFLGVKQGQLYAERNRPVSKAIDERVQQLWEELTLLFGVAQSDEFVDYIGLPD